MGCTERQGRKAPQKLGLFALGIVVSILVLASAASARTIELMKYDGTFPAASFDGSGSVGGPPLGGQNALAVHNETGNIYVGSLGSDLLYKFDSTGAPAAFSSLAPKTVIEQFISENGDVFVDNSSTPTKGRIYVVPANGLSDSGENDPIAAYEPDGSPAPNFPLDLPDAICAGDVAPDGSLWLVDVAAERAVQYNPITAAPTGASFKTPTPCDLAIDSQNNFYVYGSQFGGGVRKYDSAGVLQEVLDDEPGEYIEIAVDRSNDHVFVDHGSFVLEWDDQGVLITKFGQAEGSYPGFGSSRGIAVRSSNHKVYVTASNTFPARVDRFARSGVPIVVPEATTGVPTLTGKTATLAGTINADNVATTDCHFEWGQTREYKKPPVPCAQGNVLTGSADQAVTAAIAGLSRGKIYHFRVSTKNANDLVVNGRDRTFIAQGLPKVGAEFSSKVNSDGARVHATIDPNGGYTTFRIKYGTDTSYGSITPVPDLPVNGPTTEPHDVSAEISGLQPDTEYHYKVVATNLAGTVESSGDHTFRTFAFDESIELCPNDLARQQTGAALLLDCRGYELVSAGDTNGYDVESALVPGQKPFVGYPSASGRVLYGVHDGGIPGTGSPTNNGVDPYIATRTEDGWTTKYVGIPADGTPSTTPFASTLLGADQSLETFAFGGPKVCSPCFPDGSSGTPVRTPDGTLSQGMAGAEDPGGSLKSDGLIAKPVSADGTHLVFGSPDKFEPDGNNNGDVSIYDRDLDTGQTQVVSKTPAGANLPCLQGAGNCHGPGNSAGIAELDVSTDGSRIVVAQRVSTDAKGNHYWHPYMHVGTSPNTIDLAPGTTSGVLFSGMTGDGSKVFITTTDKLLPLEDTDNSADIYVADVGSSAATLSLVSTDSAGVPSNDDGCTPPNEPNTWNAAVGDGKCGALAFAGGAGIASEDGALYFLSPEQLDGSEGEANQANLYLSEPGEDPRFVGVMDSTVGKPLPPREPHILKDPALITGLSAPESLTVDQRNGDLYVYERSVERIARYSSSGAPKNFTAAQPYVNGNKITGLENFSFFPARDQLAVDSHVGSPLEGTIYVTAGFDNYTAVFSNNGEKIGEIPAVEGNGVCGIAVDQSSGTLYTSEVVGLFNTNSRIRKLVPNSPVAPIDVADYTETQIMTESGSPCALSVDDERLFAASTNPFTTPGFSGIGPVSRYLVDDFEPSAPTIAGSQITDISTSVATDPTNGDMWVNQGDRLSLFDKFGNSVRTFGLGDLGSEPSRGVAVDPKNGYVYAPKPSSGAIVRYEAPLPPEHLIDNPAIAHATDQAGTHSYGDFQITPDGSYATFASSQPLTGYDGGNFLNVYRYDSGGDDFDCASCVPTNARPTGNSDLASHGLSLTDDGRVFFTSTQPLVLRDTDSVKDAYEWSDGVTQLISTGMSQFDSGMFSVSADGKDAFFFTREKLALDDENGSEMRIYDAREGGGRFVITDSPQCAASDECHGPGSAAPPKPGIASLAGGDGNIVETGTKPRRCRKGFTKKQGKCVKKRKTKRHRRAGR